jgi:hypothetical protein
MRIVQVSEDKEYTQEDLDRIAESECDCDIASMMRKRNEAYGNLEGMLDERFPDDSIDEKEKHIKKLLLAAGKEMSQMYIDAIGLTSGKEKFSLSLTQKLTFKLKITNTETEVQEA